MIYIKKFESKNSLCVSKIIISNLLKYNSKDYPLEAINTLIKFYSPDDIINYSKNDEIYVATNLINNEILGTISISNNQVRNVFVKDEYHQKGIGKKLMSYIENIAQKRKLPKLFLLAN